MRLAEARPGLRYANLRRPRQGSSQQILDDQLPVACGRGSRPGELLREAATTCCGPGRPRQACAAEYEQAVVALRGARSPE
ncbi:hypothetical protein ACU686_31460 [Yinghuangia aomiensis]